MCSPANTRSTSPARGSARRRWRSRSFPRPPVPPDSAGVLVYRRRPAGLEVFLVHPGGPFWARKDIGAWSIPKGEFGGEENALDAARREFTEETGQAIGGEFLAL